MHFHSDPFKYLQPTSKQLERMQQLRKAARVYADTIDCYVPDGADKTYMLRKLREVAMWANIAVTRHADGAPRDESEEENC